MSKYVLCHSLTGRYFVAGKGYVGTMADATRVSSNAEIIAIRYTWGAAFGQLQVGN